MWKRQNEATGEDKVPGICGIKDQRDPCSSMKRLRQPLVKEEKKKKGEFEELVTETIPKKHRVKR